MGLVELIALAVVAVVACAGFGFRGRSSTGRMRATAGAMGGLAAMVDARCVRGVMTRPTAVIVVELRGLAADTIVDGADAWTLPIKVVTNRILETVDNGHLARIGPHKFGLVLPADTPKAALAVAERVVAVCRSPLEVGSREVRIEAVAGIAHRHAGEPARGDSLLREADACLQIDPAVASPVASVNRALRDYALRVMAVESEVREGLDVEALEARLSPVVDVRSDSVVLLRSNPDWSAMSSAEPDVVAGVARGLGFRRAIDTGMMLSAMSASNGVAEPFVEDGAKHPPVRVVVRMEAASLTDSRGVSHIQLLLDVVGLDPENLVVELDSWSIDAVGVERLAEVRELGVGLGVVARHTGTWRPVGVLADEGVDVVSVDLGDLLRNDGSIAVERIESLRALLGGTLDEVVVLGVDDPTSALELSALGLVKQTGRFHGRAMRPTDLRDWMIARDA